MSNHNCASFIFAELLSLLMVRLHDLDLPSIWFSNGEMVNDWVKHLDDVKLSVCLSVCLCVCTVRVTVLKCSLDKI